MSEDWGEVVEGLLREPFYICFEEPEDPLVWPSSKHPSWDSNVALCKRHPELRCGFYRFRPSLPPKRGHQ